MTLEALECPACGAPITPSMAAGHVACAYCGRTIAGVGAASWALRWEAIDDDAPIDPAHRCRLGGRSYVIAGRLARGESTDVYLADRATRLNERVLIKVLRAPGDRDLLDREWRAVHALQASDAGGAPLYTTLLPQPVAHGDVLCLDGAKRRALVYRWRSGFQHTLADVTAVQGGAIDPRHAVWIWRRTLDLLAWVHASGWAHGAILPRHLLVHPRDHVVLFAGWSCATPLDARAPLPAIVEADRALYPDDAARAPVTPATDLVMSARSVGHALGAAAVDVPLPLASLVRDVAGGAWAGDAGSLRKRVGEVAREAFGPPRYHPLSMPGWP